jgi:glyoxylase-like metal-dependent hydrolase (beta-lactamase superfamily II)
MFVTEIMEDLFFVERGYLNGNHFVYRSDEAVLIDTGYVSDFEETERAITALGVAPERVRLIVATHTHCDHIGGNRIIQERSGCEIAMHRVGKHFMDTRDDWGTWWRYFGHDADFFHCDRVLEDGDRVLVGPHEFEVLYTPGHASDGIVLYNPAEKVLISSDTLWEDDMAVLTIRVEGSAAPFAMLDSLDRLERLDVKTVYPGHGRPFSDKTSAVADTRKRLKSFLENPKRIGDDLLKKITVFTLMIERETDEETFFEHLMETHWFKETVEFYFSGDYETKYRDIMADFFSRGIVKRKNGKIFTTVKS